MTRINTTTYNVKIFSVEKFGGTAQRHNFGNDGKRYLSAEATRINRKTASRM